MLKFTVGALVVLGFSLYKGSALQCWTCSSDIDRSCADRFNASDFRFGLGFDQAYQSPYNQQPYDPYNQRPSDRDRDYRTRDYNSRDPNTRDQYDRDRSRDAYNRDYNTRDPNYRDGNRDPYFDRDHREPYNRDPNNRDYPPRDYNQGRNYDPNYPTRDVNYQRAQAQVASQSGPRLTTCNEEEARLRRMRNVCIKKVQRIGDYQLTYIRRCEMIPFEKEVGTCYEAVARGISLDFCEYCEYDGCNSATGLKFNIFLASFVPLVLIWAFSS
ncbi:polyribonucleotide nucleotidyltransferase [Dendroctonus ponderosae]